MNKYKISALLLFSAFLSSNAWAVKVYECEDEQGNRSFERVCPPGSTPLNKKEYSTKRANSNSGISKSPLVLYVIPNCDSCEQVKEFLSVRNISASEKDVTDDIALQQELKSKTGGDLRVPVLMVGDKVLSGYNRTNLISELTDAGYISASSEDDDE
jgi:glutaredoxin